MNDDDMQFLSQPLLTSEGFVNPACMNELEAAIKHLPKVHDRSLDDPEWNTPRWTSKKDITGWFALWAVRQSPYAHPDHLAEVVAFLDAALTSAVKWDLASTLAKLSLCEISRLLYSILYEQGVSYFDAWNLAKEGPTPEVKFTSAFERHDPDTDFIDLDALLSNVCVGIRDERRKNAAFDAKFEAEWAAAHPNETK